MQVKEVMTSDPACCTADTPLPEVARMMVDKDCGEIPVIDNKSSKVPIGVVTEFQLPGAYSARSAKRSDATF